MIEKHGEDGVDFVTVHCGVTRGVIERLKKQGRIADIVSRGGAFLTEWMVVNGKENPLYEQFDRLVSIAKKYDMALSLGDGLRPGSIADATDRTQVQELLILGELCAEAQRERGPGDDRRARPRAPQPDRGEHRAPETALQAGAFLRPRSHRHGRGAGLRPHNGRHRRGPGRAITAPISSAT